jgi:hypothetical protein
MDPVVYVSLGVALLGLLAVTVRWLMPHAPPQPLSADEVRRLARKYRRVDVALVLTFTASVAGLTCLYGVALSSWAERRLAALPASAFLIRPEPYWAFWLLPGVFLAFATAAVLTPLCAPRFLLGREELSEYDLLNQQRAGVSNRAQWAFVFAPLVAFAGGLVALSADWYTRFGEDEFAINQFWGFGERVHGYGDVDRVIVTKQVVEKDKIRERRQLFIDLRGGERWSYQSQALRSEHPFTWQFVDFVCRKSGKKLTTTRFIDDVPRPRK